MPFYHPLVAIITCILAGVPPTMSLVDQRAFFPVKLDVPVWSFATRNVEKTTNMNIVTYATQVGIKPTPVYAISLYKGTLSHQNFMRERWGVLQLLPPAADVVVPLLGKESGKTVDKVGRLKELGVPLAAVHARATNSGGGPATSPANDDDTLLVMTDSPMLLLVEVDGSASSLPVDVGDHDVVLCEVRHVITLPGRGTTVTAGAGGAPYLTTQALRDKGLL
jgi:flavin reductase (DIM6/NTAB) family NADH-FMN oxidoreductase RutF